jgi:hypothetical protein
MSEWYTTPGLGSSVRGASLDFLGEKGYMMGGHKEDGKDASPWLQIDYLSLPAAAWEPSIVNTGGLLNRAYHASAAIQDTKKIYMFGGESSAATDISFSPKVIEVETTSLFGLNAVEYEPAGDNGEVAVKGLTASVVGNSSTTEHIVTFGGKNQEGGCSADMWAFTPLTLGLGQQPPHGEDAEAADADADADAEQPSPWLKLSPAEGSDWPSARCFHSCVAAGPRKDVLLLCGGQGPGGELLSDLWVCDLSEVVASLAPPSSPEGDGSEEEKGEAAEPVEPVAAVRWTLLLRTSTALGGRYQHGSFAFMTPQQEGADPDPYLYVNVFGGLGNDGACDGKVWTARIHLSPEVRILFYVLPSFLFLFVISLSIYYCLSAFSDTT